MSSVYTHLIIIQQPASDLHFKEALDIALVSASYDIPTAVFIDSAVIKPYQEKPASAELEQSFNMLAEFNVGLFSNKAVTFFQQPLQLTDLYNLQTTAKHHLFF